jgi:predicted Zn-dependent peptidase
MNLLVPDRFVFEKTVLQNGITLYEKPYDVPFAIANIVVPCGHVHNTAGVRPGTAHFLEHVLCNRSQRFPELDSFSGYIDQLGGSLNATTSLEATEFYFKVPTHAFARSFGGLVSRCFEPVFKVEDLKNEATVVAVERRKTNKWFPGTDKYSNHRMKNWRSIQVVDLFQMMGSDDDLQQMRIAELEAFHQHYFDPRVYVVIGGSYDREVVLKELSLIPTKLHNLQVKYEPHAWANREYHEAEFPDHNQFIYNRGAILRSQDMETVYAMRFLSGLLTGRANGALYQWLRNEKGWSYSVGGGSSSGNSFLPPVWSLELKVATREQAAAVRSELHDRVLGAIRDGSRIERELEARMNSTVFSYQTIGSILDAAESDLTNFGRIIPETEEWSYAERFRDPKYLEAMFSANIWNQETVGEFLAVPGA